MTHRQTWQIPLLILMTIPIWQGWAGRFLRIEQGLSKPPVRHDQSFTLEEISFAQASKGVLDISLVADALHGTSDNNGMSLHGITAQRHGANPLRVESGSALYEPQQAVITLLDEVMMKTPDLTVHTPFMRYLINFDTAKSAADVAITGREISLTGTSFMYNLRTKDFRVGKRVLFTYSPLKK